MLGLGLWATVGEEPRGPRTARIALEGTDGALSIDPSGRAFLTFDRLRPAGGAAFRVRIVAAGRLQEVRRFRGGGGRVVVSLQKAVRPGATVLVTLGDRPARVVARARVPSRD